MDGTKRTKRKRATKEEMKARSEKIAPKSVSVQSERVNLCCLLGGAIVKDNGPVTGIEYTFHPGKATPVDKRDAYGVGDIKGLLARRTSRKRCCGSRGSPVSQQIYGLA